MDRYLYCACLLRCTHGLLPRTRPPPALRAWARSRGLPLARSLLSLIMLDYYSSKVRCRPLPPFPSPPLPSSSPLSPPPLSCFLDSVFLAAFYFARPLAHGLLPCARPTPLRMAYLLAYGLLSCARPTLCARHTPLRMAYLLACVHSLAFHSSLLLCSIDDLGRYFSSKVYCPLPPFSTPSLPSLTS